MLAEISGIESGPGIGNAETLHAELRPLLSNI